MSSEKIKKYLKDNSITDILNDYVEYNNLDYEDIHGCLDECKETFKDMEDNPSDYFESKLTQEDIDHATKYGYNPFDQENE